MTNKLESLERSPVSTSVRPSLKYSCSGSLLRFTNGSTTMEGLSGNASAEVCSEGATAGGIVGATPCGCPGAGEEEKCLMATIPAPTSSTITPTRPAPCQYLHHSGRPRRAAPTGVVAAAVPSLRPRHTRTGLAMFLTVFSPKYSYVKGSLFST